MSPSAIVTPFTTPLYEGIESSPDVPGLYQCAIGGHGYLIEPSLFERASVEYRREPSDTTTEPGEGSLTTRGPWARTAHQWGFGAGQDYWDRDGSDRARFSASEGVDVFNAEDRIRLHNDTREIRDSSGINLDVLSVGGYLYVIDGQQVHWTADPTGPSPTFTSSAIHAGESAVAVNDFTTDGTKVYAALGANGVHSTALGATSSTSLSTYQATLIGYANGRLVAANNDEVFEVTAAGAKTTIKDHDNASFAWSTICGSPAGIYVGGNAGDRAECYFVDVNASTGALVAPRWAVGLPDGEMLRELIFYDGVFVIATSKGLRLGVPGENNGINHGPLLEPHNADLDVRCLEPQAESVWFGWTNRTGAKTGLGRAHLGRFTSTLVPAYASDLAAAAQGAVLAVATHSAKRYFAVSGAGFYAQFADLVASGTLASGQLDFGTRENKTAVSADLRHELLDGSVTVSVELDAGTVLPVGTSATADSLGPPEPFGVQEAKTEAFEVHLTLTRDSVATAGPVLHRWTFRSLVNPLRLDAWAVPLHFREGVAVGPDGFTYRGIDPLEEYLYLKGLEGSGAPVLFQLGASEAHQVQIERVSQPRDEHRSWTEALDFLAGIVLVEMISTQGVS